MIQFAPEPGGRQAFDAFLRSLLVADWESTTGPMRFCPSLTLSDLADATLFQNARLLLAALDEAGGTPATATPSSAPAGAQTQPEGARSFPLSDSQPGAEPR